MACTANDFWYRSLQKDGVLHLQFFGIEQIDMENIDTITCSIKTKEILGLNIQEVSSLGR